MAVGYEEVGCDDGAGEEDEEGEDARGEEVDSSESGIEVGGWEVMRWGEVQVSRDSRQMGRWMLAFSCSMASSSGARMSKPLMVVWMSPDVAASSYLSRIMRNMSDASWSLLSSTCRAAANGSLKTVALPKAV